MAALIALAAFAVRCAESRSPIQPSPLSATCPANVETQSPTGAPVTVTFDGPFAAGGVQPLSYTCSPPSGSSFSEGTNTVSCTVTDSAQHTATCTFTVRVQGPPKLTATLFLAFGDSLTFGTSTPAPTDSYPVRLQPKLALRYTTQTISIINDGVPGENAFPTGRNRLPGELMRYNPGALLLMEGSNDLLGGSQGAANALVALEAMVQATQGRGIRVLLATIPPQRPGGPRDAVAKMIPGFNDSVRALAQREGATLVDIYAAMANDLSLIGPDDLHPTPQGLEVMAQTFFDVIKAKLEVVPPATATAFR